MGCVCSKQEEKQESLKEKHVHHQQVKRLAGSARVVTTDSLDMSLENEKVDEQTCSRKQNDVSRLTSSYEESAEKTNGADKRYERAWLHAEPKTGLSNIPKHLEGELVAAGWPVWLSAVAGEAIKGWIPRRADAFEKLDKIGQGTYSNVYKARDLDTGKLVALKKVRFDNLEPESVRFMAREILVLRRLNHPNVIRLEGLVTSRMSCSLYLVFEYMEHDLVGLTACPGVVFTEEQVKCYLLQLLRGLDHCHSHNVLHRDIKGSNLLLDNEGILKIADFGLATIYHESQKQPLTSRVVTLWYRAPELLLGATEYGVGVDLWSTGCILAELLARKPIMPGRTEVEQLHKIFKLCGSPSEEYWQKSRLPHATIFKPQRPYLRCLSDTYKSFPVSSLKLLEILLAIEPAERGTAAAALSEDFFTTKPLPCEPSSLPKYPPSKEFDARIRDEEARRKKVVGGKVHASEAGSQKGTRGGSTNAVPAPDANAEVTASLQKRGISSQPPKSNDEKFAPLNEDTATGFPVGPPPLPQLGASPTLATHLSVKTRPSFRSGPLAGVLETRKDEEIRLTPITKGSRPTELVSRPIPQSLGHQKSSAADLFNLSSLVAARHKGSTTSDHDSQGQISKSSDPNNFRQDLDEMTKSNCSGPPFKVEGASAEHVGFLKEERTKTRTNTYESEPKNEELPQEFRGRRFIQGSQRQVRISHSGPLIGPSGRVAANVEELLEAHERKMQLAARRAIQEAGKSIRYSHAPVSKPDEV